MKQLHIIMPMAGDGTRYTMEGYSIPKPLVEFHGTPLFAKSMSSLDCFEGAKRTFIVKGEHISNHGIDSVVKRYYPESSIIAINGTTRGSIETVHNAMPLIDAGESLIFIDCDLFFVSDGYQKVIKSVLRGETDARGVIATFNTDEGADSEPRYSYALSDVNGCVARTAEKVRISDKAIIGSYFIRDVRDFTGYYDTISRGLNENFYISPIYNNIISDNGTVLSVGCEVYKSFGTPFELERSLRD